MITIHLSALGLLRQYLPVPKDIEIEEGMTLEAIALDQGVPRQSLGAYMVNGNLKKGDFAPSHDDEVKLLMLMGAG